MKKQTYFIILLLILISACTPFLDKQAEEALGRSEETWKNVENDFEERTIERYTELISIKGNTSSKLVAITTSEDKNYFETIDIKTKEGHRGELSLISHELKIYYDCDENLNCKEIIKEARNSIEDFVKLEGKKLWFVYWDEPLSVVYITEPNHEKYFSLFEFEDDYDELMKFEIASEQDEKMQEINAFVEEKNSNDYALESIYNKNDKRAVKKEKIQDFLMQEVIDITQLSLDITTIYAKRAAIEDNWPEIKDLDDTEVLDLLNEKEITVLKLIEDVEYDQLDKGMLTVDDKDEELANEIFDKIIRMRDEERVTTEKVRELMNKDENVKSKYLRLSAFEKRLVSEFGEKMYQDNCKGIECVASMAREYNSEEFCRHISISVSNMEDYEKKREEVFRECIALI